MGSCVAFNCTNRCSKKVPGLTFHSFPREEKRRKLWILAVRRVDWVPTRFSKLCSKHFPEEMIDRSSLSCVRLRENAVPSIFDFPTLLQKKRPAPAAAKSSQPNIEPEVVIKEEPIDIDEAPVLSRSDPEFILPCTNPRQSCSDPIPSRSDEFILPCTNPVQSRSDPEFILPCTDPFQSGSAPIVAEAFTVVKSEPVTDPQLIISNGRTTISNNKKPAKVAEQCLPAEMDSATTENKSAKDHIDAYGDYIVGKLRILDWKSCAYVQKAIADILYDAELGKFK